MNEEMIKGIVKFKFDTAREILDHLPAESSEKIRKFARVVFESVETVVHEAETEPKGADTGLHNIVVE